MNNITYLQITVPIEKLLNQADFNYSKKVHEIKTNIAKIKAEKKFMNEVDVQTLAEVQNDKALQHWLSMKKIIHEVVKASSSFSLSSSDGIKEYKEGRGGERESLDGNNDVNDRNHSYNSPYLHLQTARASWVYNTNTPVVAQY